MRHGGLDTLLVDIIVEAVHQLFVFGFVGDRCAEAPALQVLFRVTGAHRRPCLNCLVTVIGNVKKTNTSFARNAGGADVTQVT